MNFEDASKTRKHCPDFQPFTYNRSPVAAPGGEVQDLSLCSRQDECVEGLHRKAKGWDCDGMAERPVRVFVDAIDPVVFAGNELETILRSLAETVKAIDEKAALLTAKPKVGRPRKSKGSKTTKSKLPTENGSQ